MQLYDVMTKDNVFVMRAPVNTVAHAFMLRSEAIARLLTETDAGKECRLHFNGRDKMGLPEVTVFKSTFDLPTFLR